MALCSTCKENLFCEVCDGNAYLTYHSYYSYNNGKHYCSNECMKGKYYGGENDVKRMAY